ncbi:MAG: tRNA (adenosine(37)-N6)-threonylcarbamoyltransferase complex dimerization subunit type 1 TsaB [Thermodesulfobacteriota bacterium]
MKILGIDTSTSCGSVGLVEDEWVISDYLLDIPVTHSERLLKAIDWVLKESRCGISEIDGLAISLGPGSFTGLRIGVSTLKGLALSLGKPVAGISTLEVLASQVSPTPYLLCPILDARKGEVYTAFYRYEGGIYPQPQSPIEAIGPGELVLRINEPTLFFGSGVKIYGAFLKERLQQRALFPPPPFQIPHGSTVAKLGLERLQRGERLDLLNFTPLYIRPSEAEIKWRERFGLKK